MSASMLHSLMTQLARRAQDPVAGDIAAKHLQQTHSMLKQFTGIIDSFPPKAGDLPHDLALELLRRMKDFVGSFRQHLAGDYPVLLFLNDLGKNVPMSEAEDDPLRVMRPSQDVLRGVREKFEALGRSLANQGVSAKLWARVGLPDRIAQAYEQATAIVAAIDRVTGEERLSDEEIHGFLFEAHFSCLWKMLDRCFRDREESIGLSTALSVLTKVIAKETPLVEG